MPLAKSYGTTECHDLALLRVRMQQRFADHIPHTPAEFERDSFLFERFSCRVREEYVLEKLSVRARLTQQWPGFNLGKKALKIIQAVFGYVNTSVTLAEQSPHEPSQLCPHVGSLTPPELPRIESQTVAADLLPRSLAHGMRSN
ncbi:hypothetical protein PSHT_06979 [Puccinia striiformis]|nr:hypothetical protein KEM48_010348 [Puccinia striiformis f. sp. tritici PST-130]POW15555.1 hypothetical protein PSHT_06979 [Puccinia striiformis]